MSLKENYVRDKSKVSYTLINIVRVIEKGRSGKCREESGKFFIEGRWKVVKMVNYILIK